MSATITTTDGTYTGRTVASIVRRVYGRTAHAQLIRSAVRNPVVVGQVVSPACRPGADADVHAAILSISGDFGR